LRLAGGLRLSAAPSAPSYDDGVAALIKLRCLSCHSADAVKSGQPDLSTYKLLSADNFSLATAAANAVMAGTMPQDHALQLSERVLLMRWRFAGFPENNASGQGVPPDPADPSNQAPAGSPDRVTYAKDLAPLVAQHCVSCHGKGQQAPDLTDLDAIKANGFAVGAASVARVVAGDMPRPTPLSSEDAALFQAWSDQGFLMDADSTPYVPNAKAADSGDIGVEQDASVACGK
jgi:mono/diheme cytochrome c family protein